MSAREALFWALWDNYTPEQKNGFMDAFAHELAERQRAWAVELERLNEEDRGYLQYDAELQSEAVRKAADLIDPTKGGDRG